MNSKHTPGPWNDSPTINLCGCHHVGLNIGFLATTSSKRYEEGLANARLIAAAPELLEALVKAVECGMVPTSSVKDGGASKHSQQVRCADMIRAVIAKATGEQQ